jgi:hypothetical protein
MHVKIVIQGEVDFSNDDHDNSVVNDIQIVLGILMGYMIDNSKFELLVDGLPY